MPFTEAERVKVRRYLGFSVVFNNSDPRLESAMTTVEAYADTVTEVQSVLTKLASVETRLEELQTFMEAHEADDAKVDPARGLYVLRSEGRRYVRVLETVFDTKKRVDAFMG